MSPQFPNISAEIKDVYERLMVKNSTEDFFAMEYNLDIDIHKAYKDARRHKRNTINQLRFEANLERGELELTNLLQSRQYELLPSICFINKEPVKREIIAANFRDRACHHLLYNWIFPIFDRQFIYDSYSCHIPHS